MPVSRTLINIVIVLFASEISTGVTLHVTEAFW